MTKRKILFVCTLNTIRSAVAQFLLEKYASERFECKSCGICASNSGMSPTFISVLNKYEGISKVKLSNFRSTRFSLELADWADSIVCVTREHASIILDEFPKYSNKVTWFELSIPDDAKSEESAYACVLNIKKNLNLMFDIESKEISFAKIDGKNAYRVQLIENEVFREHAYPIEKEGFGDYKLSFLAKQDNKVVGYVITSYACDQMDVISIAVKNEYRRQGIGEKILKHLFELAKEKGITSIFLEVRYSNDSARLLYEKVGFIKCGLRRDYYTSPKEDAILYEYKLK